MNNSGKRPANANGKDMIGSNSSQDNAQMKHKEHHTGLHLLSHNRHYHHHHRQAIESKIAMDISNEYLKMLMEAEENAKCTIDRAREKFKRRKEAVAAEVNSELLKYEDDLKKKVEDFREDANVEIEDFKTTHSLRLKEGLANVSEAYKKNKDNAIKFLVHKTITVSTDPNFKTEG
ncbi:hypothetical protein ACOME3_005374 [Neoechinorhynchus agilis]